MLVLVISFIPFENYFFRLLKIFVLDVFQFSYGVFRVVFNFLLFWLVENIFFG